MVLARRLVNSLPTINNSLPSSSFSGRSRIFPRTSLPSHPNLRIISLVLVQDKHQKTLGKLGYRYQSGGALPIPCGTWFDIFLVPSFQELPGTASGLTEVKYLHLQIIVPRSPEMYRGPTAVRDGAASLSYVLIRQLSRWRSRLFHSSNICHLDFKCGHTFSLMLVSDLDYVRCSGRQTILKATCIVTLCLAVLSAVAAAA
ncbi:hypothetical protein LZ32DRAFT_240748 [Colletotrichum eremochloae]|nr:hypothetical protein LZ32DRAFT_240748 [Colletotrichum eremochloae]